MGARETKASDAASDEVLQNDGLIKAIHRAQAVIEFELDGTILTANDNFLAVTGYRLDEVQGKHHRMFCDPAYAASDDYHDFWMKLAMGEFISAEFQRFGKGGKEVWINASYNPIFDADGKAYKVVKFASDITARKIEDLASLKKVTGFEGASSAMMMVDRDFIVTHVNGATTDLLSKNQQVFAKVWPGFDASNIIGTCIDQFHKNPAHQRRMLSDPKNLPFKTDITIGEFKFALNVDGIFDDDGEYVGNLLEWADVTEDRVNAGVLSALDKTQATIAFFLDGTITDANENFLSAVGYRREQIVGNHHSMFCDPDYAKSPEYRRFWADLAEGKPQEGEFCRLTSDGSEIWIQATYNPIVDGNGKVFKVVKFATDITKQVEMRRTAETLSLVANETENSVIITDARGRIEYVNPALPN